MTGIDYSGAATLLGREYVQSLGLTSVNFIEGDLLDPESSLPPAVLAVDKGTFDAMSLNPDEEQYEGDQAGGNTTMQRVRSLCTKFKASLMKMLDAKNPRATFLITSCNWTGEELVRLFAPEFIMHDEITHPSFTFGGKRGQTVTTIAFKPKIQ